MLNCLHVHENVIQSKNVVPMWMLLHVLSVLLHVLSVLIQCFSGLHVALSYPAHQCYWLFSRYKILYSVGVSYCRVYVCKLLCHLRLVHILPKTCNSHSVCARVCVCVCVCVCMCVCVMRYFLFDKTANMMYWNLQCEYDAIIVSRSKFL